MRSADVVKGTEYAVKLSPYGSEKVVARCAMGEKRPTGKWAVTVILDPPAKSGSWSGVKHGDTFDVSPAAIIEPWADHVLALDHETALREDAEREWRAEYEAKRAAHAERVAAVAPAFDGITIDRRALGTSTNTGEPMPVDLGEWIREAFETPGCSNGTITIDLFAALAERLREAQEAVLTAGGGWASGPDPIIDGQREVVHLAASASAALARLEAALEDADD